MIQLGLFHNGDIEIFVSGCEESIVGEWCDRSGIRKSYRPVWLPEYQHGSQKNHDSFTRFGWLNWKATRRRKRAKWVLAALLLHGQHPRFSSTKPTFLTSQEYHQPAIPRSPSISAV